MNNFKRFLVDAMVQNLFASEPVEEEKVEQMLERIAKKILTDDEKHLKLNKSIVCGMLFDKKIQWTEDRVAAYLHFYLQDDDEILFKAVESSLEVLREFKELLVLDEEIKYLDLTISRLGLKPARRGIIYLDDFYHKISDEEFISVMKEIFTDDVLEVPTAFDDAISIIAKRCGIDKVAEYRKDNTTSFLILDEKPITSQQWAKFCKTLSEILNEQVIVKIKSDFRSNEDKYFYNEIKTSLRPVESMEGVNLQHEFIF